MTATTISRDTPVGRIAAEHPLSTRVFARHGIDYCCGGGTPLGDACAQRKLSAENVIEEIQREIEASPAAEERWDQAPLTDLVAHILAAYHEPLHEELPRLAAMAKKVRDVHRDKDPERLEAILAVYLGLKAELDDHLAKEELILFPMIQYGRGARADGTIAVMAEEHLSAAAALLRLRELTNDFQVPAEACNTWRALWHGLAALEESLHRHIHLENNVLFPRALKS